MFVTDAPFSTARLDDYRPLVGDEAIERIRARAEPVRGARVLHVNATAVGGGVAEILLSLVPLMRAVGLHVDWFVLDASDRFFEVTKRYHNALQGQAVPWSPEAFDVYWDGCRANAHRLADRFDAYDFVVVHDPQPLALQSLLSADAAWIWRCHIDLTTPSRAVWEVLSPHLAGYDMVVFTAPEYVREDVTVDRVETALPCIDPFRPKNRPVRVGELARIPARYGIDPGRPYVLQVSRFDPWKDPCGVLGVYQRLKPSWPELQFVYMAAMARDDPEARHLYRTTREAAGDDPDVHLLALEVPPERVAVNALHVNAMQRGARVVLQKSIREGFGLVVTEALWKEKPVVAGNVGGIRYQIRDGWNGYLVDSVERCAERVAELLDEPERAAEMGRRGRDIVTERFLFTRLLEQYLGWFGELAERPRRRRRVRAARPLSAPPSAARSGTPNWHAGSEDCNLSLWAD